MFKNDGNTESSKEALTVGKYNITYITNSTEDEEILSVPKVGFQNIIESPISPDSEDHESGVATNSQLETLEPAGANTQDSGMVSQPDTLYSPLGDLRGFNVWQSAKQESGKNLDTLCIAESIKDALRSIPRSAILCHIPERTSSNSEVSSSGQVSEYEYAVGEEHHDRNYDFSTLSGSSSYGGDILANLHSEIKEPFYKCAINQANITKHDNIRHVRKHLAWLLEGAIVKLSEVPPNISGYKSIKIIASDSIVFDRSIEMHGKNLIIIAPTWHIVESINIDLSGMPQKDHQHARRLPTLHRKDGQEGKDGGNFYGIVCEVIGSSNLVINVSGGKGQNGQNGKNGRDGSNGKDATINNYLAKHISSSGQEIYKGFPGESGGDAGKGGKGGAGGKAGDVEIITKGASIEIVQIINMPGEEGSEGMSGVPGYGGKHGNNIVVARHTDGEELVEPIEQEEQQVHTRAASGKIIDDSSLKKAARATREHRAMNFTKAIVESLMNAKERLLELGSSRLITNMIDLLETELSIKNKLIQLTAVHVSDRKVISELDAPSGISHSVFDKKDEAYVVVQDDVPAQIPVDFKILWHNMLEGNYSTITQILSDGQPREKSEKPLAVLREKALACLKHPLNIKQFPYILLFGMHLKDMNHEGADELIACSILVILDLLFSKDGESYHKDYQQSIDALLDIVGDKAQALLRDAVELVLYEKEQQGNFKIIYEAAQKGYNEVIKLFHAGKGDIVNFLDTTGNKAPLYVAMLLENDECVEELLSYPEIDICAGFAQYKPIAYVIGHPKYQNLFKDKLPRKLHEPTSDVISHIHIAVESTLSEYNIEDRDCILKGLEHFLCALGDGGLNLNDIFME